MAFSVKGGVYPTMITPYRGGQVDIDAAAALVDWYYEQGCDGIFAVCQSSEIFYLTLNERVALASAVVRRADELAASGGRRMMIVASGHISDSYGDQQKELRAIAETGVDALILISNRMDIANTGDDAWIAETSRLVEGLPADLPLGIYECPKPYKRLLTEKMIKWCAASGRFYFIKDTCCDAALIERRIEWCKDSPLKIFNANAQTLLPSLRAGGYGYCGVMANFHPSLYAALIDIHAKRPDEAEKLAAFLSLSAFTESLAYPCTAKYHLRVHEGLRIEDYSRSRDESELTDYHRACIDQMNLLSRAVAAEMKENT